MRTRCLSLLSALSLLAHALWGCCWHHAPETCGRSAAATTRTVEAHTELATRSGHAGRGCCMHGAHHAYGPRQKPDDSETPATPSAPESCDEAPCQYVRTEESRIVGSVLERAVAASDCATESITPQLDRVAFRPRAERWSRDGLSAASRCALLQSWQA